MTSCSKLCKTFVTRDLFTSFTVNTESLYTDGNQRSSNTSVTSLDDVLDNQNIFSDPESEWEAEQNSEQVQTSKSPDSWPEVDQSSTKTH